MQRMPFFRLLLALVSGIVLYHHVFIPDYVLYILSGASLVIFFFAFSSRYSDIKFRFRWLFGVGVFLSLFTIGYGLCYHFDTKNAFTELNKRAIYEVELITSPVAKARSNQFRVKLLNRLDSNTVTKVHGKAIIYLQKDSIPTSLLLGDRILVDAEFKAPDGVQNPNGFDYSAYLKRQGVGATAYVATGKWREFGRNPSFSLKRLANQSRNQLLEIYRKNNITDNEFAVLAALTLGYTESLDPEIYKLYSNTGAVHILSVSGLHVGIVYVAIFSLLGFLKRNRKQVIARALISVLFIWIYAIITGLSPAVLRAAMMMTFVAVGTCLNRKVQIYNSILGSAFFILLISPNLLYNIGFQLSYSAVLSIVAFQKFFSNFYTPTNKFIKSFWSLTTVSLAAQLGTAPISIYYFSQFPNYFLLTNYVAIPLSTVIIYMAIFLLFISFIPFIAYWTGFVLKWLIWLMNYLLGVIAGLPGAISVLNITGFQLFALVAAILLFTSFTYTKRFSTFALSLSLILLFFVNFAFRQYQSLHHSKLIIFSDSRTPIINFIEGKNNFVFTNDPMQAMNVASAFWRSSLLKEPRFVEEKSSWFEDGFARFKGKNILILKDDMLRYKRSENPVNIDYLILTNKIKPRMDDILDCVNPKLVIIDKSISPWYTQHVVEKCNERGISYYSIAEKGAFIENFE